MNPRYQQARFLKSSTTAKTLPPETGPEVAFAGRSNAGKSSAINVICTQKALARTSKTPGRTQLINFFELPEGRMLVDLPGYGYAKAPEKERRHWGNFIDAYLHQRETLRGLVLLMDIRHPLTDFDRMMLAWAQQQNLAVHILLNKADKLKFGAAKSILLKVQSTLQKELACLDCSVQLFSALKRQGREEIWQKLDQWLYD